MNNQIKDYRETLREVNEKVRQENKSRRKNTSGEGAGLSELVFDEGTVYDPRLIDNGVVYGD